MVLFPVSEIAMIKLSSWETLLSERLGMTELTVERQTYVWTGGSYELWDRLHVERRKATEPP